MIDSYVFLDTNAIIYALDETSEYHTKTVQTIQKILDAGSLLCSSHHVIEEVIHVSRKLGSLSASVVVDAIGKIPNLILIEPDATIAFAQRYANLSDVLKIEINDALILQLMIDAGIDSLLSYDKKFVSRAEQFKIKSISDLQSWL